MKNKLILEFLENGNIINKKEYKSLMAISKDFPQIEYHQLREVYLTCSGKNKRKLHSFNSHLCTQISITDNPNYYNCIVIQKEA